MKRSLAFLSLVFLVFTIQIQAQKIRRPQIIVRRQAAQPRRETTNTAIVVDERLAVLRSEPSLYAMHKFKIFRLKFQWKIIRVKLHYIFSSFFQIRVQSKH